MNGFKRGAGRLGLVSVGLLSACAVPVGTEYDPSTIGDELSLAMPAQLATPATATTTTTIKPVTTATPVPPPTTTASAGFSSSAQKVLDAFGIAHGWTKDDV